MVTLLLNGAGAQEVWLPSPLPAPCAMALLLKNSPGSECCLSSGAVRENTTLVSPGLELIQGDTLSVTAMELGGHSVPPSLGFQG